MTNYGNYKTEYQAVYYDGKSPVRHNVVVTITRDGLKIVKADNTFLWWSLDEINQTNDVYSEDEVKLERGKETPEILLIDDISFIQTLKDISPSVKRNFKPVVSNTRWLRYALSILIGSILTIIILYKWLLPAFADFAANFVPVSWEEKLGKNYKEYFVTEYEVCEEKELTERIDQIKQKLVKTINKTDYKYNITILDSGFVNAFALPGGEVVIFKGLIEKSKRPEELAGVMAHEMQHIEQKHSTKILIKNTAFDLFLSTITGSSDGVGTAINVAKTVGLLAYRRSEEASADTEGLKMLIDARIDPNGLTDFFHTMKKEYGNMPDIFKYISTHPDTEDRIDKLDTMIKGYSFKPEKLLPEVDWDKTRMLCSKTKQSDDVKMKEEAK